MTRTFKIVTVKHIYCSNLLRNNVRRKIQKSTFIYFHTTPLYWQRRIFSMIRQNKETLIFWTTKNNQNSLCMKFSVIMGIVYRNLGRIGVYTVGSLLFCKFSSWNLDLWEVLTHSPRTSMIFFMIFRTFPLAPQRYFFIFYINFYIAQQWKSKKKTKEGSYFDFLFREKMYFCYVWCFLTKYVHFRGGQI